MILDQTKHLVEGLRAKLDAAALEALQAGHDWCEIDGVDLDRELNIHAVKYTVAVTAGPIPAGSVAPPRSRVIRHSDWVKAGKPGLRA